jgi:hypothetical protein
MSKQRICAAATVLVAALSMMYLPAGYAQGRKNVTPPFQVVETSIDDIHAAYKSRKLTARQLVQRYLDRIIAYDKGGPNINSIITLNPNALQEADKLDAAYKRSGFVGPLHGIPVLVKDEIDAAGMPTTHGTLVFKDYQPPATLMAPCSASRAIPMIWNERPADRRAVPPLLSRRT